MEQQDHSLVRPNQLLAEARGYLLEGDEDLAIEALKEEMANGTQRCIAAFYLYFLDSSKDEYLEVLNGPNCKTEHPLNDNIVQKYLASIRKLKKCTSDRRILKRKINTLSAKLSNEEKERKRLNFELKKLEQIRRETEKLRLKK